MTKKWNTCDIKKNCHHIGTKYEWWKLESKTARKKLNKWFAPQLKYKKKKTENGKVGDKSRTRSSSIYSICCHVGSHWAINLSQFFFLLAVDDLRVFSDTCQIMSNSRSAFWFDENAKRFKEKKWRFNSFFNLL